MEQMVRLCEWGGLMHLNGAVSISNREICSGHNDPLNLSKGWADGP